LVLDLHGFPLKGRQPTAEEKRWMNAAAEFGCVVCHRELGVFTKHHRNLETL